MAELDELTYEAVEDEDSLLDQKWAPSEAAHARDEDAACEDDCEDEGELGLTQAQLEELARLYPERVRVRRPLADMTTKEVGREG